MLPRVLRSLATLPMTRGPSHALLEGGLPAEADQLPTGASEGPRCHFPVKTKKDWEQTRTAYIFQKSELGHYYVLHLIADVPGLLTWIAAPEGDPPTPRPGFRHRTYPRVLSAQRGRRNLK